MPTQSDREMLVWANAVRVDPEAFAADYQGGGCRFADFKAGEKSAKPPFTWSEGLNAAARFHSEHMARHDCLTHGDCTKPNGNTSQIFGDRVARFYDGFAIGENVAWDFHPNRYVLTSGWMCSSGHRENVMAAEFTEFGGSRVDRYSTQNFGAGTTLSAVIAMGSHVFDTDDQGRNPVLRLRASVAFGAPAEEVWAVVDGARREMKLAFGTRAAGSFVADADDLDDGGCHIYWFEATQGADVARFPEEGAYAIGDCAQADAATGWVAPDDLGELEAIASGEDGPGRRGAEGGGCQHGGGAPAYGLVGLALLAARRRRQR